MLQCTLIIGALLCTIATNHVAAIESSNDTVFSRVIETRLPNPVTLSMGSALYTISKTKQTLSINSTSGTNCKLNVDPFEENIQGRINAGVLDDSKNLINVWGIQKSQLLANIRRTYYTLLIVDVGACSYIVVKLPVDEAPADCPPILPQLILQGADFEVFYPSQSECNPCDYWQWGDKDDNWHYKLPYYNGCPTSQFLIKSYDSMNYYNMFIAYNNDNGTAMIKVLDLLYYRDGWQALLSTTVDAAAVSYGTYQNTAICSVTPGKDRREVECARLTSRMEVGTSWNLPLKNNVSVSDVSIEVDQLGNTFIGVIDTQEVRVFIYNVDAQLVADLDFGKLDEKYTHRDVTGFLLRKEFCLVAVVHSDPDAQDVRHVVKCVDITKYIKSKAH